MQQRSPKLYIADIKTAITRIEKYTKGMTFRRFVSDTKTIDAVVRNLEIIGEAARMIPEQTKQKYPEILWKEIVGMRNKIAHEYFGVALDVVWSTAGDDIPELKKKMKKVR